MKYLITIIGTIASIFLAFFKGSQSATYKIKAKLEESARKHERTASDALIDGLQKEKKAVEQPIDYVKRDEFE